MSTDDPFATATIRRRVLDGWQTSAARFREDANAEEDLVLGGYRDRLVVELAQNAVDAASRAGEPARLLLRLEPGRLIAANNGAPLDAAGVEALSTLRASAKREGDAIGRFGVGFAAVLAVTDEPALGSRGSGGVCWSRERTYVAVAERAKAAPELADELRRREGAVPVLRLPEPAQVEVPDGFTTAVVLALRDDEAEHLVRRLLDGVDETLLLALPGLAQVSVETAGQRRELSARADDDGLETTVDGEATRWIVVRREGRIAPELLAARPVEERAAGGRWAVTWALPAVDGPALPGVLLAPTPTDEPLGLGAVLVATFPLEPTRRRTAPGPLRDAVATEAGRAYAVLLAAVAVGDPGRALTLVPGPAGVGEVDGLVRAAALHALPETAFVPTVGGALVRPRDATVVEGAGADALAVLGDDDGPIPDLVPALAARAAGALERLGARRLRLADAVDLLAGLRRPPAWWRALYAALEGVPPDELGALPVPLADGRLVRGARGAVLADGATPPVLHALGVLGARAVDPEAAHPLLERLGATRATAGALLDGPAVREAVEGSLDLPDDEAADIADAVLALVESARPGPGELPHLGSLALADGEGELAPASELTLPGGDLGRVIEPDALGAVAPALLERWGPDVLEAVGVLRTFALVRQEDVALDPDEIDLDVDDEDGWAEAIAGSGGALPPVASVVTAVRDLDLVRPDAWPEALALLARPPLRDAVVEPVRVVRADGRSDQAPSYTAWWLRAHARLDGRPLTSYALPGAGPLLSELYPPLPVALDPVFAAAVGVRTSLADLLAQPGGAQGLLDRLADPAVTIGRDRLRAIYAALADVDPSDVAPPDAVRVPHGTSGTRVVPSSEALVLDRPDLLPLVATHPLVVVPAGRAEDVAELLGLALASEQALLPAVGDGVEHPVPDLVRAVLPDAAATWFEHDALAAAGGELDWLADERGVHATTLDGLARGLAWAAGQWERRGLVAALLLEPERADELLAEADLDAVP